jgi:excisionase family DNA binding protein
MASRLDERLVYTVPQAGRLLGLSRGNAYALAAKGELPVIRMGRRLFVPKRALEALLESATPRPAAGKPE